MGTRALVHTGQRPVTLRARLRALERNLSPRPSWMHEEARADLRRWLTGAPEAPELWAELETCLEVRGSIGELLGYPESREVLLEVSRSMLTFTASQTRQEQRPWEQHS